MLFAFLSVVFLFGGLSIWLALKSRQSEKFAMKADLDRKVAQDYLEQTKRELEPLKKYEKIRDLEHAEQVIVDTARAKAKEAFDEAKRLQDVARELASYSDAIRNTIEGYGDRYHLPSSEASVRLGEEWSHRDHGVQLKRVVADIKKMTAEGRSVESHAHHSPGWPWIAQMAFDCEVELVLNKVKHDNYGRLEQKIKDAASKINGVLKDEHGVSISPKYVKLRIKELRYSVAIHELKKAEREEQAEIKRRMREEERARKEYEKAIAETEKKNRMLEQARLEVESKLQRASEDQRRKLEDELNNLRDQLEEAREAGKRAESMAQRTRAGNVYVISNIGSFGENVYKIGMTRRLDPMDRVKELGDASVPFKFDVHAMVYSNDAPQLESKIHAALEESRLNKENVRKEFFVIDLSSIRALFESQGVEARWTMVAEAEEYRASKKKGLAEIDRPLLSDQLAK